MPFLQIKPPHDFWDTDQGWREKSWHIHTTSSHLSISHTFRLLHFAISISVALLYMVLKLALLVLESNGLLFFQGWDVINCILTCTSPPCDSWLGKWWPLHYLQNCSGPSAFLLLLMFFLYGFILLVGVILCVTLCCEQSRMSEAAADAVEQLLAESAENDLASLCSWADNVRFRYRWSAPLHYINTPDLCNYQYSSKFFFLIFPPTDIFLFIDQRVIVL